MPVGSGDDPAALGDFIEDEVRDRPDAQADRATDAEGEASEGDFAGLARRGDVLSVRRRRDPPAA